MKKLLLSSLISMTVAFSANAADTIKIAVAGATTGPVAQYGQMQVDGTKVAVDEINKAGGVNGKQLEMVVYDDACEPK